MMPANDPVWMYLKKPHSPVITIAAAEYVATVKKVLSFAHIFTNGHSFPCLKMADFFVTAECERLMSRCSHLRWRHGGVSDSVTVFTCIVSYRCYHTIAGKTFERPISAWWSDVGMPEAVLDELTRLGLWLREENCLISLLLQQVVLKKRGDAGRRKIEKFPARDALSAADGQREVGERGHHRVVFGARPRAFTCRRSFLCCYFLNHQHGKSMNI